jgi:sugar phosphate isomerase/epimerase
MTHLFQSIFGILLALFGANTTQAAPAAPTVPLIGVQLWSVKDEIKKDFEGMLTKLAGLGFDGVEFAGELGRFNADPAGLRAFMDKTHLKCAGAHLQFEALAPAKFDATTAFYKTVGCRNLVIASDNRATTTAGSAEIAKEITALAAKLKPLGLRIGYHNHAQEMAGAFGKTPWDVLAKNTPKDTIMQQDVGWTTFAGKDPIAYVKRYPGRTITTHFKAKFVSGEAGTPVIGTDHTDWAGLVRTVRNVGGTEWIIIEQADYPAGMGQFDSVAASMRGLQAVLAKQGVKAALQ